MSTKRKEVEAINLCFTQEVQIDYSTRNPSFPVSCGPFQSFGHLFWVASPVMETFRGLGLGQSIAKHLLLQKRPGRHEEADYLESFISVFAAGGDCFDDFELLRRDAGLRKVGLKVPSAESARRDGDVGSETTCE